MQTLKEAKVKPGDAFLSIIDFFSTLVPGAVAAFLLLNGNHTLIPLPSGWYITWGSNEGWVVFLVAAYLLGHAIAAIASLLDKLVYDRWYACWRRADTKWVESKLQEKPTGTAKRWPPLWKAIRKPVRWCIVLAKRLGYVWNKTEHLDTLQAVAIMLKNLQLRDLLQGTGHCANNLSSTYAWAGTVVRLKSPVGTSEIEGLQAQSKLFRSLAIILLVMVFWRPVWNRAVWLTLLVLSLLRFCYLRWTATERTYEYFLALALPSNTSADVAHLAYSYWEERGFQGGSARADWLRAEGAIKDAGQHK